MITRILVPTDFSSCSINALRYAIKLAKRINLEEMLIMHAYTTPVAYDETETTTLSDDIAIAQHKEIEESFDMVKRAVPELKEVKYQIVKQKGIFKEALTSLSKSANIDLVIMGTTGATGIDEIIFGTNAYTAIKESKIPVLVIPKITLFNTITNIALASDFKELAAETFEPLKSICRFFDCSINIVHIDDEDIIDTDEMDIAKRYERYFKDYRHQYHYIKNNDVENGIKSYLRKNQTDILTVVPRKHPLFDKIFGSGESKSIVFHTEVPLLALPEIK